MPVRSSFLPTFDAAPVEAAPAPAIDASPAVPATVADYVRADGVSLSYGVRTVLTDVSLTVPPGSRVGLIGENGVGIRTAVCQGLTELGIELDPAANAAARGEAAIHAAGSRVQVWVVPTNEEIVVARLAKQVLQG